MDERIKDSLIKELDRREILVSKFKEYVTLESEQVVTDRCGKVIFGEITFDVAPSIDEWTKTKTVTIKYELFNINDINKLDKYTYTYTYSGSFEAISGDEHSTTRTFKATTNGTVTATIKYEGIPIQPDEELVLDKIDNEGPRISITNNTTQTVKQSVTIPIKITDNRFIRHCTFLLYEISLVRLVLYYHNLRLSTADCYCNLSL